MNLKGKAILITGAARRIGKALALAVARSGATVMIHYGHASPDAEETHRAVLEIGSPAHLLQADLADPSQTRNLISNAWEIQPLYALVNSAAIFEPISFMETDLSTWQRHLAINLTAPFLLSQVFRKLLGPQEQGRIVNILDWRALRPQADHLAYTISKAGLAALTKSLAVALAPNITVNGLALGAILPPSDGAINPKLLESVPAQRWAELEEVSQALLFLLSEATYTTGEIIHVDGGRHLI